MLCSWCVVCVCVCVRVWVCFGVCVCVCVCVCVRVSRVWMHLQLETDTFDIQSAALQTSELSPEQADILDESSPTNVAAITAATGHSANAHSL